MRNSRFVSLLLLLALPLASLLAGKDKKGKSAPAEQDDSSKRIAIDIGKLAWPNPPAVARIRYVALYTGEKIDFKALKQQTAKKQKQNWMDRLAGSKPVDRSTVKVPFQFLRVYGVATDSKGFVYAADAGVSAIFIINPQTQDVQLIRNGKEAHFGVINGLAMDDNDRLFVSDMKLHRIAVFTAAHEQEATFGADVLISPAGLAIDRENRFLYVVDTQRDQVLVFDADNYKFLRSIGTTGKKHELTDAGNFSLPTNAAVDADGNLYVTDTLNNRVEIFDADGGFIGEFGKAGDSPGFFTRPKGIAVDSDGHIWVVDEGQSRVQVFNREGRLLIYVGEEGAYPGQFQAAYGIAIAKDNRVIVSEQFPGRVQVFRYVTDAEAEVERKKQADASGAKGSSRPDRREKVSSQ